MHAKAETVLGKIKDILKSVRGKSAPVMRSAVRHLKDGINRLRHGKQVISMGLKPLYPLKNAAEHQIYVRALDEALEDDDIRNIALTGSYGSGKSSVLKDFADNKQDRAVWISFSTLGADIEKYTNENPSEDGKNKLENRANLIQKEIVKQILYREKYARVPASRYPKIYKITIRRTLFWALASTVIIPSVLFGLGKYKILTLNAARAAIMMGAIFVLSYIITRILLNLVNRVQLQKLSGGPVSIALSTSNNYFDQYLDEIIYFFEATEYDVVILEDIDRFNDLYVFENLRQLNNLLNNSKQIGNRIRFIYAVKDSIFHEEKESDGNRTKFFDLIIPTVPFITHRNSRDVIAGMFNGDYGLDRNVVALTAKHVTDMRLLKNIYNEFKIFHQKIMLEGKITGLSTNNLFAMLVYKNIYLEDFERIRIGKSVLDEVYGTSRTYVADRYQRLSKLVSDLKEQINSFDDISNRCIDFGLKLTANMTTRLDDVKGNLSSYVVNGVSYDRYDQMQSQDFWANIAKLGKDGQIEVTYRPNANAYGTAVLVIPKSSIKDIIGVDPDVEVWKEADVQPLNEELKETEIEMDAVRGKSIQQLIHDYPVFSKSIRDLDGVNELVHDLLAAGYIDANYWLYTSIYREDNVSAAGMNFIVRNLQAGSKDFTYKFADDEEIRSMLNDLDDIYLESRSIYNFDIVDFMLRNKDGRIIKIAQMLAEGTNEDLEFLNAFIENNGEVDLLIIELSKIWPGIFTYLASNNSLDRSQKNSYLGTALMNADLSIVYGSSADLVTYLEERAGEIGPIDATSKPMIAKIIKLLKQFKIEISNISKIKSKDMRDAIQENSLYAINAQNVGLLIGNDNLSLTNIKAVSQPIFERMTAHLDQYVSMADDSSATAHSVENSEDFLEVLKLSSTAQSSDVMNIFIEMASDDCFIDDINEVDGSVWPLLFASFRVFNTLSNVIDYYVHKENTVDANLESFLGEVQELVDNEVIDDQAQKKAFAISILNSALSVAVKANIVKGLGLDEFLKVAEFNGQNGELYGHLIEAGVIEDSATTFNNLVNMSWATKEFYISKSPGFEGYISEVKFSSDIVTGITSSLILGTELKNYLINNAVTYKEFFSSADAISLTQHAIRNNLTVSVENLRVLLDGPNAATGVELIHQNLSNLTRDDLLGLLAMLGDEYAKLGQPNKHPKLDDNTHNQAIVAKLTDLGVVSSYNTKKNEIKVNIRSSW